MSEIAVKNKSNLSQIYTYSDIHILTILTDLMAKKKATMTLKDFHGGSIPSDLPLPSAPGA